MALKRISINSREEWLKARGRGIGASEAATAVSMNIYSDRENLIAVKAGEKEAEDLSNNKSVKRGVELEPILRELFIKTHSDIDIEHHPYDMLYQEEVPWRYATLDGELTRNGKKGILEIKTAEPKNRNQWGAWKDRIPDYYYAQVLHQLLATGYDFVILYACLFGYDGDITIREYEISRDDCEPDMKWISEQEEATWKEIEERKNENQRS